MQYFFCDAQQEVITSYQNDKFDKLNIVLNGQVKNVVQVSYSPNNRCDTIPSFVDDDYYRNMPSGIAILIKCMCDTMIYHFDKYSSPTMIKHIVFTVDASNIRKHRETVYMFDNGNLSLKKSLQNGIVTEEIAYQYDSNNNLTVEKKHLPSFIITDSLEYDSNNNLLKKFTYSYAPEIKRRDFKKIKGQYFLKKNREVIWKTSLYASEEYQYDVFGNMVSKTCSNNRIKDIYVYDTLGNKIEEGYCENYNGKNCKYKPSHGYVYDENNRLIKCFSIGDWKPHNTTTYYSYDEHGRKIEVKAYYIYNHKDTVIGYHRTYEYYEHKIKENFLLGKSNHLHDWLRIDCESFITTYDDYKNIIKEEYYDNDNQNGYIISYVYTYDSRGNWIKKEEYRGANEDELEKVNVMERKLEYY